MTKEAYPRGVSVCHRQRQKGDATFAKAKENIIKKNQIQNH
jgi:hypothetical protein